MQRLYLDVASRWPLREDARQAISDASSIADADPTRSHLEGRMAADLLERATATVAEPIGVAESSLIWTSGGTESVHLAVLGSARAEIQRGGTRRHLVCSAVEHSSVLRACERLRDEHGFELDVVGVDGSGVIDPERVAAVLRSDTLAVHLQHANH
ncbi:MAG: cysteine desulfurase, partial [Glaciecola sp.]